MAKFIVIEEATQQSYFELDTMAMVMIMEAW
jgi:hypothetical protein